MISRCPVAVGSGELYLADSQKASKYRTLGPRERIVRIRFVIFDRNIAQIQA
jgi:hypothetical protein